MGSIGAPWLVFVAAATYRQVRGPGGLPRPAVYVGSAVVFTMLGLMATSDKLRPLAATLGWGLVVSELIGGQFLVPDARQTVAGSATNPVLGFGKHVKPTTSTATAGVGNKARPGIGNKG